MAGSHGQCVCNYAEQDKADQFTTTACKQIPDSYNHPSSDNTFHGTDVLNTIGDNYGLGCQTTLGYADSKTCYAAKDCIDGDQWYKTCLNVSPAYPRALMFGRIALIC